MDELSLEGLSWEALPFEGPRRERLWGASEARAVPGRVLAAAAGETVLGWDKAARLADSALEAAAREVVLGRDKAARVADSARAGISQIARTL